VSKIFTALLMLILLTVGLTACGGRATPTPQPATPSVTESAEIGPQEFYNLCNGRILASVYLKNTAEYNQKIVEDYYHDVLNLDLKYKSLVYVDSLTDGLLMLRSHKIDLLHVMRNTGYYLTQRYPDLQRYDVKLGIYSTQMIFSPRQYAQYLKVNAALKEMKEDGTLAKLINQWITRLPVGQEPSGATLPVIPGAETFKMGISGDEPPLDYIAADGQPGGFNVAVVGEISRRTNLNIELVNVVSGARFVSLQSGKIDAFLWHNSLYAEDSLPEEVISPEKIKDPGYIYKTISYLDDKESLFMVK
jgi:ABC-type amino acid transport substrate-binding protein